MDIDLIPLSKFIKLNNIKPITNPILCERGTIPTSDGLLSTEIFGMTMDDRKNIYGYIPLNGHYLVPHVYKVFKRVFGNITSLVNGTKEFVIEGGELKVVPEGQGNTGLEWLYENWEKIKFPRNDSDVRNERLDLLESFPKEQLFCDKWIVMPAYYRDMNLQKKEMSHDELNDLYSKLIRLTSMNKNMALFDFVAYGTQAAVQDQLVAIYDYLKHKLEKKKGMIRKALLGKKTDYSARLLITAPRFDSNKPSEQYVNLDTCGLPLAYTCSLFMPFIVRWIKRWFERELFNMGKTYPVNIDGKKKYVEINDPSLIFTDEEIHKQIDRFIYGDANRFTPIEVPIKNPADVGGRKIYMAFVGRMSDRNRPETVSNISTRPLTWCDLLYQAAIDVVEDKHVIVTRYPVLDYFGSCILKIHVESTMETIPVYIGDRHYPFYPKINLDASAQEVYTSFIDSLTISNLLLKGMGGDYDGDQVTVKPLFTQEANIEAEKILNSKSNILDIYGGNMRNSTNEAVQTIYQLTRRDT